MTRHSPPRYLGSTRRKRHPNCPVCAVMYVGPMQTVTL